MLDSFLTFINQHTPDLSRQPTLLAVSGGMDSVLMAHLFHQLRLPAGIAHCNFQLRGEESDGDEAFVQALAEELGFPFFFSRPDVKSYAAAHSVSTQMAARQLRYDWFEALRAQHGYHWIATAHHANDSLETVLMNLARGTGLAGLTGIAPVNGNLIRPLLYVSRAMVADYVLENGIAWRDDRSNQTDDYNRNKVRHHVIPVLEELNPSLESTFNASAERLRAARSLLDEYLLPWKLAVMEWEGSQVRIPMGEITGKSEPLYRLWVILQDFGFQYGQMQSILNALDGIPGKQFHTTSHTLLVDRQHLIIQPSADALSVQDLSINAHGTFRWRQFHLSIEKLPPGTPIRFDSQTIAIDAALLRYPLTMRTWRHGDVFHPFGMAGKRKKVSDLLIDRKVGRFEKEQTAVLLNGDGEIIWVVGIRADERFKVTDRTRDVVCIALLPA